MIKQFNSTKSLHLSLLVLILILSSCSSTGDRKLVELSSSEIVEEFNIQKEDLEKFSVIEKKVVLKEKEASKNNEEELKIKLNKKVTVDNKTKVVSIQLPKEETTPNEKIKPENSTLPEKVTIIEKKEIKVDKATETVVIEPTPTKKLPKVIHQKVIYPEGYPAKFKKFDKASKEIWKKVKPRYFEGEKISMKVSYMGVTAGHLELMTKPLVMVSGEEAFHFSVYVKSADFYSYVYSLDDKLDSIVSKNTFIPIKYSLIQRESGQRVDDLQLFDREKLKTFSFYRRDKKGKITKKQGESFIPQYFNDSFSSVHFVRSLPLKQGDEYLIPIVNRSKTWVMKLNVVDTNDIIRIGDEKINAIKIKAETHFHGVLKKRGDIVFWYSNDDVRKLLKFNAKVKLGSIDGEMVDYQPGNNQL